MHQSTAEIVREYGPFPGIDQVHGVSYDGKQVWFASGDRLNALDPSSGVPLVRSMSRHTPERHSTADTFSRSPTIESRRSIRRTGA